MISAAIGRLARFLLTLRLFVEMASFWVDLLIYIDARFIVLASAGAALFLAYVGVLGSQVRSSEEVSESRSQDLVAFLLLSAMCCTQTT